MKYIEREREKSPIWMFCVNIIELATSVWILTSFFPSFHSTHTTLAHVWCGTRVCECAGGSMFAVFVWLSVCFSRCISICGYGILRLSCLRSCSLWPLHCVLVFQRALAFHSDTFLCFAQTFRSQLPGVWQMYSWRFALQLRLVPRAHDDLFTSDSALNPHAFNQINSDMIDVTWMLDHLISAKSVSLSLFNFQWIRPNIWNLNLGNSIALLWKHSLMTVDGWRWIQLDGPSLLFMSGMIKTNGLILERTMGLMVMKVSPPMLHLSE